MCKLPLQDVPVATTLLHYCGHPGDSLLTRPPSLVQLNVARVFEIRSKFLFGGWGGINSSAISSASLWIGGELGRFVGTGPKTGKEGRLVGYGSDESCKCWHTTDDYCDKIFDDSVEFDVSKPAAPFSFSRIIGN